MSIFNNISKNTVAVSNLTKNTVTPSNLVKSTVDTSFHFLIDSTNKFLIDSTYRLNIGGFESTGPIYSNLTKN